MRKTSLVLFMVLMISCSKESVKKTNPTSNGDSQDEKTQEVNTQSQSTSTTLAPPFTQEEYIGKDQVGNTYFGECRYGMQVINGEEVPCEDDTRVELEYENECYGRDCEYFNDKEVKQAQREDKMQARVDKRIIYKNERAARKAARKANNKRIQEDRDSAKLARQKKVAARKSTRQEERSKENQEQVVKPATQEEGFLKKTWKRVVGKRESSQTQGVEKERRAWFSKKSVREQVQEKTNNLGITQKPVHKINPPLPSARPSQTVERSDRETVQILVPKQKVQIPSVDIKPSVKQKAKTQEVVLPTSVNEDSHEGKVDDVRTPLPDTDVNSSESTPEYLSQVVVFSGKMSLSNVSILNKNKEVLQSGVNVLIEKVSQTQGYRAIFTDESGDPVEVLGLQNGKTYMSLAENSDKPWGAIGNESQEKSLVQTTSVPRKSEYTYTLSLEKNDSGELVSVVLLKKQGGHIVDSIQLQ